VLFVSAGLSGVLLFLADFPVHAWPLGAVALVPLIAALARARAAGRPGARGVALAAAVFGIAYHAPLLAVLRLPFVLGVPLALALTVLWVVTWLLVWWSQRAEPLRAAVCAGAAAALVEWSSTTLIPVWGTAQSFVRTWSAWPPLMQLAALGGVSALAFALVAWQTLLARSIVDGGRWRTRAAAGAVVLAAAVIGFGQLRARAAAPASVRVAAVGWRTGDAEALGPRGRPDTMFRLYEPLAGEAAAAGARVIVSPETGFVLTGADRASTFERLGQLARRHHAWLVVGYLDRDRRENRAALIDPTGARAADYQKTHLIPFLERTHPGAGDLVQVALDGAGAPAVAGAMICQDDNFADLARRYGRRGVALVAVPTYDWSYVAPYHFENSRFRAVEGGYGIVRAAADGVSAVTDARGHVLAARNHLERGAGVVVADLPLHPGGTPYSGAAGASVPFVWLALLALFGLRRARGEAPA